MKFVSNLDEAVSLILDNKSFIYPTDTLYGIGINALYEKNIKKVYDIKKRDITKPISVSVGSISMIDDIAYFDSSIFKKIIPGPFTFLLSPKDKLPKILYQRTKKIGVRVPDHPKLLEILNKAQVPITSTSANISGGNIPKSFKEIDKSLVESVDFILDIKPTPKGVGSTILDLGDGKIKVLRNELFDIDELSNILGVSFET